MKFAILILSSVGYLLFKFLAFFITNFGASLVIAYFYNTMNLDIFVSNILPSENLLPSSSLPRLIHILEQRTRVSVLHVC